ncbi:MAG: amidase, Asp-tRNAAsn/Glu-tRNAGln amidotransferase subunit [Rubritepida sp.]|nr:amidase, Asp-tRNAAsn/Glu-tRNAGln amidotransferase subunit [Rubritepida sp.]
MKLHDLTVTQTAAGLRKGEFSPVELVEALLARIAETEPDVEAWEVVDADGALRAARWMTERMRERPSRRSLWGIPIGIKDIFDVKGLPTSAGFEPYRGKVAGEDAGMVTQLREAGAIVLGKTVTVQFATALDSPKACNPWDLSRTPGGSSSGSAASVAARQVAVATGTQTGGSILRPAAYCGVVGIKPTFGRISRYKVVPVSWSFDHPGFLLRSVADAALMLEAVAMHDPRDPFSAVQEAEDFVGAAASPLEAPELGLVMDLMDRAEPPVREAMEKAATQLAKAGARIRPIRLPVEMDRLLGAHFLIRVTEAAAVHAVQHAALGEHYEPNLRANIEIGQVLPAWLNVHSARLRRRYRAQMSDMFSGLDGLIAPTASNLPPDRSTGVGDPSFQVIWSFFGMPNITLPTGLSPERLPHGMQIIAPCFGEARMFRVAAWAESVFGPMPSALDAA